MLSGTHEGASLLLETKPVNTRLSNSGSDRLAVYVIVKATAEIMGKSSLLICSKCPDHKLPSTGHQGVAS